MSGKPAGRLADIGSGHGCHYPPSPAVEGSPNVFINGRLALRVGDALATHACPIHGGAHGRKMAQGAATVFFNGKPAVRLGDGVDCGGALITGSPNVFIGNSSPPGTRKPFCEECEYARDAD